MPAPTPGHMQRVANVQKGYLSLLGIGCWPMLSLRLRCVELSPFLWVVTKTTQMAFGQGATAVVAERGEEGIAKVREVFEERMQHFERAGSRRLSYTAFITVKWERLVCALNYNAPCPWFDPNISAPGWSSFSTTYDKQFFAQSCSWWWSTRSCLYS